MFSLNIGLFVDNSCFIEDVIDKGGAVVITRSWLKEVLLVILVAVTAFSIALLAYAWERERGEKPSFYQSYFEPAIRMTCGQPFGVETSGKITDEMNRFLKTEQQTLTCESVPTAVTLEKNPSTRGWYHLFVATAQVWKITGISWPALDGFAAALLAIAAVMVFALFRLLMPVLVAAPLAIVSILPALRFLPYLRDLNKAPFILAALFVAVWLVVRTPTRLRLYIAVAALGGWLGIGYGFRPDVLIVLPLLIVTILFFRPGPQRKGWLDGALASAVLVATFIAAASPIFSSSNANVGSCTWHFGLLGLSEGHTGMLGVTPSSYSWLVHYDDNEVWRSVESYGERALSLPSVGYCTPLYDQASKALYLETFRTFPGDFMARGLAAAQAVIEYGFWGIPWTEITPTWGTFFANHRSFLHGTLFAGWLAVVLFALAWNVRVGLFSIFALAYLGSYPAIQFDQRHYFHLAFLFWLPVGLVLGWISRVMVSVIRQRSIATVMASIKLPGLMAWIRAAAIMIAVIGIGYAVYRGGHHEQRAAVQRLFGHYLRATGDEVVVAAKNVQGENIILTIAPPERSDQNNLNGRMLRLDIGGPNCTSGTMKILAEFGGSDDPTYVFKKELVFEFTPDRAHATVFFPAYFDENRLPTLSLVLLKQDIGCVEHATWLRSNELPPLWVLAILYPDWRESRLSN